MSKRELEKPEIGSLKHTNNGVPSLEFVEFVSRYPEVIQFIEDSLKPKKARRTIKEIFVPDTVPVISIDPRLDLDYAFISHMPELQLQLEHFLSHEFGMFAGHFSQSEKYYFDLLQKEKFKKEHIISLKEVEKGQLFTFIPCSPRAENAQLYKRGFKVKKHIHGRNVEMISTNDPRRFFPASQLVLV